MKFLEGLLLPALLLARSPIASAKDDGPLVEVTPFDSELGNILFFDDSEVALLGEIETGHIFRSEDAGKTWAKQKDEDGTQLQTLGILKNPYDNKVAIAVGERQHWITHNRGEKWTSFKTKSYPSLWGSPVGWHAGDSKKIIFSTLEHCDSGPCIGESYYTTDGFKSDPKLLRADRKMCMWARSSDRFLADKSDHEDRALCIVKGKFSGLYKDFRLVISDDFFDSEDEPGVDNGRTVSGMANMASVKGYFVVAAKAEHSTELALYVTDDTATWHQAQFGEGKIEQDAYTILESTNYSIQVDVVTSRFANIGSLYTSNSNGTYFTKNIDNTNRNMDGFVDFEKIANIQGIVLVNIVDNADQPLALKKIKSQISFSDGRDWNGLKTDDDEDLHLHSVTNLHNSGRVFSSPAPGFVMGVGNTGKYLGQYTDGNLYVSRDAGLTWNKALDEAHKYEFGDDGSVLVAVYDEGDTKKIMYSFKHGQKDSWKAYEFDSKIRFRELTTIPDSTALKFIAYGAQVDGDKGGRKFVVVHIDFTGMLSKCKDSDFDNDWTVDLDKSGKASCVMGHTQTFRRRKSSAECFIGEEFKDPMPRYEPCDCDEVRDYECDFNFRPEGTGKDKKCVPSGALSLPDGACKNDAKSYKGSSGWRKIPGNQCKGKTPKDDEVERPCDETSNPPTSEQPTSKVTAFSGKSFREHYYLERPIKTDDTDETIVMLTNEREAWITHNHGKEWKKVVEEEIVAIYPHMYNNDRVFFLTAKEKVYYSTRRGLIKDDFHDFTAPTPPQHDFQVMQFHPKNPEWIIWLGGEHCSGNERGCHTVASVSQGNGVDWKTMMSYVKKCAFVWREQGRQVDEKLTFCEQYTNEDMGAPLELIVSEDWFASKDVKFKSVVAFATMSEFIIVATKGEDGKSLKLDASLDGKTFADARFPPKFEVDHQTAYTVLDSSTHSVFLHVTVNPRPGQEYGSIIKSNSNGTSYVLSLNSVNRNTGGYVDFEKMQGVEGVAMANIVANIDAVNSGEKKKKKTKITHNDGADWQYLPAPEKDVNGKKFGCNTNDLEKCSLHIHGYTERPDPRETYSSPTAVGIMMGIGNVGEFLGPVGEASTWITTDAGITWSHVKEGNYAWEYGDQGSVIVIVNRAEATRRLYFTLDMGKTWKDYEFHTHEVSVESITTVPSDTSLNFLIWGKTGKDLVTINVDFTRLPEFKEQCKLTDSDPESQDYDLWSPKHPEQEREGVPQPECLFGHISYYHRKKESSKCYQGHLDDVLHDQSQNCSCARRDFECDYNYERMPGGECQLIKGLNPPEAKSVCDKKGVKEYWEITGYRKIPISTCSGGSEMDHTSVVKPCPGYEKEFQKKHGISGFGIFLAVVIPFVAAGGIGYYVWKNWDGKFGRIRLGDGTMGSAGESPWITWPVAAISAIVAVVVAVPMLIGSAWRAVAGRFGGGYDRLGGGGYGGRTYNTRSSFARGRGDYAVVDPDEGELLGDESDEDV
ncbi:vacuolar protein sorting/targeting protein 10 [Lophiotrema nucula]|uniref:Vacuolar protein sorting/targeting protein 10 n=1 Tax=Lophiotrema nucula TaxID=690887 RepID=A0A6A5YHZ9_9PLEO|nr:vacuolar protein sorting/targeting protein 10 [Lophiotrema nucula]